MNNKILKNYLYNLIYQIIIIVMPIITTPYISRVLGANNIGIFSYDLSIVTYFILVGCLGTVNYGQRKIAQVQDDINKRSKVFYEILYLRIITLSLSTFVYFITFCLDGENKLYFRVLLLEIIATIFDISWYFQGIEEFKKISIRNSMVKLISVISIFIFIKNQNNLSTYFVIYVLSTFLGNITLWIRIKKYIVKVDKKKINLKEHIKPMVLMFIPQIAISVYTILDKIMLGYLCENYEEVGFYEQSQKIIKISLTFVTSMSTVMIPRISRTFATNDKEKINIYMKDTFEFLWFIAIPILGGIIGISPNFVPWFFGEGYDKVKLLLSVSSCIIIFISCSTVIGSQYLMSIKKQNIHSIAVIIGAIVNFITNIILIKYYSSLGAVIATCLAEFIIAVIEILYVTMTKRLKIDIIFSGFIKPFIASIFMLFILLFTNKLFEISVLNTFIQIFISVIVYCIVLLILKYEQILLIIKKMNKILKK